VAVAAAAGVEVAVALRAFNSACAARPSGPPLAISTELRSYLVASFLSPVNRDFIPA